MPQSNLQTSLQSALSTLSRVEGEATDPLNPVEGPATGFPS